MHKAQASMIGVASGLLSARIMIAAETVTAELHYAPAENLERVDVALIGRVALRVDMAACVLTDVPVSAALARAADRTVAVRILLDRGELEHVAEPVGLIALQDRPTLAVCVKRSRVLMHLKSCPVDGRWLRSGGSNLTGQGLRDQDNDLLVLHCPALTAHFTADIEAAYIHATAE